MFRRLLVGAAIIVWSASSFAINEARAQSLSDLPRQTGLLFLPKETAVSIPRPAVGEPQPVVAVAPGAPIVEFAQALTNPTSQTRVDVAPAIKTERQPNYLVPLYASTAVVQALDVHSTLQLVRLGGGEGNPMLQGLVQHEGAFIAYKAAIAATTIYAASRIAKHNKLGAALTLVGINAAYALVASHNYSLARQMR
jgi:hypothetical protein